MFVQIVYPFDSATMATVFPLPTWDERVSDLGYLKGVLSSSGTNSKNAEIAMVVVNSIMLFVCAVIALMVWIFREEPTIKASSRRFSFLMLGGCIMMLASNYFWTMYETDASCIVHIWIFSLGYILFFAPLFARTWRLYRSKRVQHQQRAHAAHFL
jgi:uncharacterized membrane protein